MEYFIYKEKDKWDYILSRNESYKDVYLNIFRTSYLLENKHQIDLYQFTITQLEELMVKLKSKTKDTARARFYRISEYLETFKHLRDDRQNPLAKVGLKWFERFVDTDRTLIHEDELEAFIARLKNSQDQVFFRLIFEGVCGTRYSELLHLKKSDVDYTTNTLHLYDSATGNRSIQVSNRCMNLIKEAVSQEKYWFDNVSKYNHETFLDLDYVLYRRGRNTKRDSRFSGAMIKAKIDLLKEISNIQDMTVQVLKYSGMAKKAIEVSQKLNTPVRNMRFGQKWREVAHQFNIKPAKNNSMAEYYPTIRNHLDVELINELYGELEDYRIDPFVLVEENDVVHEVAKRKRRIGSQKYKEFTFSTYQRCAISGESFRDVLEACHIQPYINEKSNHIQNSILLRTDLHTLFDKGYITIDETYTVRVSKALESDYYQKYHGKKVHLPENTTHYPSKDALVYNLQRFVQQ